MRAAVSALGLALVAAAPAPTATPPKPDIYASARAVIADFQKIVTPNGVQESYVATLGGTRQWVTIRGADRRNPILVFIHGGPAAPETPESWAFQRPWEDYFTVVQYDQRASGKSFPLNDPIAIAPTLTLDRYRDDCIELIEQLRARFGKRKVFLLGHSWGSAVGLAVAAKRPDLLHAYVGAGQIIDFRAGERLAFDRIVAAARADHNAQALKELDALRPYPRPGPLRPEDVAVQRKWSIHYGFLTAGRDNADYYFSIPRLSPEYTPADMKAWGAGSDFTIAQVMPKLGDISFASLHTLDVPVFMFLGDHDYTTPSEVTEAWMKQLRAPEKGIVRFPNSAHLMMVEEPGRFFHALMNKVRPVAVTAGDGPAADSAKPQP